ncbi:ethanolamine ammonia-lyase [Pueribacillus theae]|uniref:Ethanolamine ammonia-lyase small subunit n=1 Tax=Pueribacillus theae TaxID=2171751 RepID=A0A2U1K7C7_9BACI|nr:ethanolamine ammonia-lyase subunit EutC [Pueribacillus theae]PWA13059.1 ethanolamine ammonia-lyase [Pueribacillus theae]
MDRELVEKVTKMILSKMSESGIRRDETRDVTVKFWNHGTPKPEVTNLTTPPFQPFQDESNDKPTVKLYNNKTVEAEKEKSSSDKRKENTTDDMIENTIGIENPIHPDELMNLVNKTPARIGIGRAGLRPKTKTWLKFRFDHAAAVDAVYGHVDEEILKKLNLFSVNTKVDDKEVYIRRPDFGRKLSDEAKQLLEQKCIKSPTVQIIVSDGLSSKAIDKNIEDVYLSLGQSLKSQGIDVGTPFFINKGRVAVMDEVGELLKPKVVVLLIGERPGLVSAESLSAYLCYEPRIGTIEADRMVISNIHRGGIPPVEAGAYLGTVVQKILKYEASGVGLVQREG